MMHIKSFIVPQILLIWLNPCLAQSPGVRNGHNMVYDSSLKSIILFGGATESKVCGDTWSFSAGNWTKITDSGPSPRTFPCMGSADNYILLFGGNAVLFGNTTNPVHYLDDTWKFENGSWKKVKCDIHPSARAEAAMGCDPVRKRIVLFGGRQEGEEWIKGDTWEFDGEKWKQMNIPGPTPRSGAVMIYDTELKELVLYGGNPVIKKEKDYNGAMWAWDGIKWTPLNCTAPLIFNSCMAYNANDHFIFRFGGWDGEKRINETWIYRRNEWIKLHIKNGPAARNHSIVIYDPENNSFYLYGGHDGSNVFGDMWMFKNGKWNLVSFTKPLKRLDNGH